MRDICAAPWRLIVVAPPCGAIFRQCSALQAMIGSLTTVMALTASSATEWPSKHGTRRSSSRKGLAPIPRTAHRRSMRKEIRFNRKGATPYWSVLTQFLRGWSLPIPLKRSVVMRRTPMSVSLRPHPISSASRLEREGSRSFRRTPTTLMAISTESGANAANPTGKTAPACFVSNPSRASGRPCAHGDVETRGWSGSF